MESEPSTSRVIVFPVNVFTKICIVLLLCTFFALLFFCSLFFLFIQKFCALIGTKQILFNFIIIIIVHFSLKRIIHSYFLVNRKGKYSNKKVAKNASRLDRK